MRTKVSMKTTIDWNARSNAWANAVLAADRFDDLLDDLSVDLEHLPGGTIYRGSCPIHGGVKKNFQLRLDGDVVPIRWACYSRHCERTYKGSFLGFVRGVLSFREGKPVGLTAVEKYLQEFMGCPLPGRQERPRPPQPEPKLSAWPRERVRQRLVIPSPYFVARGFNPAILDRHDVGHSPRWGKSVVPLYDDSGETGIGYMARSELPSCEACGKYHRPAQECRYGQPKWKVPDNFPKTSWLYNYQAALRSDAKMVLLVEGPGDVWRAEEAGYLAVATLGADLSPVQAEKLAALNKMVVRAFDNDEAGRAGARKAFDLLLNKHIRQWELTLPDSAHDLGEMQPQEIIQCVEKSREDWELLDRILDGLE
jgi:hypothetical protein